MVAVQSIEEAIPAIESGRDTFDPDDMPPPPDQFSIPPEVLAEMNASASTTAASGQGPAATAQAPVDPEIEAMVQAAASKIASKASLTARIRLIQVKLLLIARFVKSAGLSSRQVSTKI